MHSSSRKAHVVHVVPGKLSNLFPRLFGPKESVNGFGLFLNLHSPGPFISFGHLPWPDCSAGVPLVELISKVPEQICSNLYFGFSLALIRLQIGI